MQTIDIAKLSGGEVIALDLYQVYLDELKKKIADEHLENIQTVQGSMFELPFPKNSFDVIWSEGAIYIIGFEQGLKEWRLLLKDKGYLAVTHISWLRTDGPAELIEFWAKNYPAITTIDENLRLVEKSGYKSIGHFILPESAWWDDYYNPIEIKLKRLREKYLGNKTILGQIEEEQLEIYLYRKYSNYYGYVFYVMQKTQ